MRNCRAHTRRHWRGGWPRRPAASDYDSTASPARAHPNLVYHAASAAHTRPEPAPGSGFNRSVPKP